MKSRDALIRSKRFQAEENRRRVAQLQAMIAEFTRMTGDLDREIVAEEQRANISDPSHFAYPTYARAARARRENLVHSANELRNQLQDAEFNLKTVLDELAKVQSQEAKDRSAERMLETAAGRRSSAFAQAQRRA